MSERQASEFSFRTKMGGAFLSVVIMAYFLQPLVSKSNPLLLGIGGTFLGFAVDGAYERSVLGNGTERHYRFIIILIVLGMSIIGPTLIYTGYTDWVRQFGDCARLEKVMLHGRGKSTELTDGRSAPHDAFTALGCRPSIFGAS